LQQRGDERIVKFWFWFLWSIGAFIAVEALYFFFSLAAHGRVASFNILPWLIILAVLAAVVEGSVWLRSAALYVLFFLVLLIIHPNFH